MEHCAKRWQTREGTYLLKRRRLKPDVRDPPEDKSADVGVADMNNGWRGGLLHGAREPMRGAERGSERFTLSHLFCEFPWLWCCCWCLVVVCWVVAFLCFLVVFSLPQKFLPLIRFQFHSFCV